MWESNDEISGSDILRNQFTAYLGIAIRRKKAQYLRNKTNIQQYEMSLDILDSLKNQAAEADLTTGLPLIDQIENTGLRHILTSASRRDLYILLAKTMENRSFIDVAAELGLAPNTVVVAYHRIKKRIKNALEGDSQ